jgi:hypothetical protein
VERDLHECSVLKVGADSKGLFIGISLPYPLHYLPWGRNPLRWSEERGRVVDCFGDVVTLFGQDLQLDRGACSYAVKAYHALPRTDSLPKRFSDSEIAMYSQSPEGQEMKKQLFLILRNAEISAGIDETCLVLRALGIELTPKNILGFMVSVQHVADRVIPANDQGLVPSAVIIVEEKSTSVPEGQAIH